jgi:uncharacterized protein YabN with tetrapyrrole methylase and pyrophosphatase domain
MHSEINASSYKKGSLTVVGTGIKMFSQMTIEAKVQIENAERLLFITSSSLLNDCILLLNPKGESLAEFYTKYPTRKDCYRAITNYIVEEVKKGLHVCTALYGHPTVFALPALAAVELLKKEDYATSILPGISAEDCLFADLCIDPGTHGCQSFETTDFLVRKRNFDIHCHLILWQVGIIACPGSSLNFNPNKGASVLQNTLSKFYPNEHDVFLYESAFLPQGQTRIEKIPLRTLGKASFTGNTTLYVPPLSKAKEDAEMLLLLGLSKVH